MTDGSIGIFLSHVNEDKDQVRAANRRLQAAGYKTWLDEDDIFPGQDWDLEIQKAMHAADLVIVFLSRAANQKSSYYQKEVKWALDRQMEMAEGRIFTIPARLDNSPIPFSLGKIQAVNLFEPQGWDRLLATLARLPDDQRARILAGGAP